MGLPTHAEIVIVGGGIAGCSSAYHLAKLGKTAKAREQWRAAVAMDLSAEDRARATASLAKGG